MPPPPVRRAVLHRAPVEVDGARAAVGGVAADMRARQAELVAQEVYEGQARLHLEVVIGAVDLQPDPRLSHASASLRVGVASPARDGTPGRLRGQAAKRSSRHLQFASVTPWLPRPPWTPTPVS